MDKTPEKLSPLLARRELPAGLSAGVFFAITKAERRRAISGVVGFGILALSAIIAFIPSWRELQTELIQSGFTQFISLLFTDFGSVAAYWKEFSFSLLESLPTLGLAAVFASAFAFLFSLRFLFTDISKISFRPKLNPIK